MNSLPTEAQIDVLKCFNFDQLFSFKQTNFYFWKLFTRYEEELARIEFISLSIVYIDKIGLDSSKVIPLKSGIFEFTLNDQLKKKWQAAIDESIPLYLHDFAYDTKYVIKAVFIDEEPYYILELPNFPKNIKEMIIIRCWMEHLSKCCFRFTDFYKTAFNPEIITLLFDNDRTPLKFHTPLSFIIASNVRFGNILKFVSNHLTSLNFLAIKFKGAYRAEYYFDVLIKFLTNGNNNSTKVFLTNFESFGVISLHNFIIKHIKTSKNLSKFVASISISYSLPEIDMNEREKVELEQFNNLEHSKFEIVNIHNSTLKFSFDNHQSITSITRM